MNVFCPVDGFYPVKQVVNHFHTKFDVPFNVKIFYDKWNYSGQFYTSQVSNEDSSLIEGIHIISLWKSNFIDVPLNIQQNLNLLL